MTDYRSIGVSAQMMNHKRKESCKRNNAKSNDNNTAYTTNSFSYNFYKNKEGNSSPNTNMKPDNSSRRQCIGDGYELYEGTADSAYTATTFKDYIAPVDFRGSRGSKRNSKPITPGRSTAAFGEEKPYNNFNDLDKLLDEIETWATSSAFHQEDKRLTFTDLAKRRVTCSDLTVDAYSDVHCIYQAVKTCKDDYIKVRVPLDTDVEGLLMYVDTLTKLNGHGIRCKTLMEYFV